LLVLPSVVILVALMAMLMMPHGKVQEDVGQINAGLAEVLSAEGFASHYERQLRECAAFVATGSAEHERLFEQARQQAGVDIGNWVKAEVRHTGDTPGEHAEELGTLDRTEKAYGDVNKACDWVIALARSGQGAQAIASLEDAANGRQAHR